MMSFINTHLHNARRLAVAVLILLITLNAEAFDTFWHSAATGAATKSFGFSADATNIVQFGNFSGPDFFGPLFDTVAPTIKEKARSISPAAVQAWQQFHSFREEQANQLSYAIYMHFDNLHGDLDGNGKFDYLFQHLLRNTRETIDWAFGNPELSEGYKKMAILMALGGSLHMVQDFYSHSNWIHQDFASVGMSLTRMPWGKDRAPTWFEVRAKFGDPDNWPRSLKISSGIYPPTAANPLTHTHMNHDNSQLFYDGASQVKFHDAGPVPASNGAAEHQLFAVNTAAGASMEWIRMVEEDPMARKAIEYAKTWDLKSYNSAMLHDLEGGLGSALMLSCLVKKWDGDNPSQKLQAQCAGMISYIPVSVAGEIIPGMTGVIPSPYSEFWAVHTKCALMGRLTRDFAGENGHYNFSGYQH